MVRYESKESEDEVAPREDILKLAFDSRRKAVLLADSRLAGEPQAYGANVAGVGTAGSVETEGAPQAACERRFLCAVASVPAQSCVEL